MKIAVITCYFDPDYVRARTIRAGLQADKRVRVIVVKNTHRGLLRYPEIVWKLFQVRHRQNPDAYVLTFRGQEILPLVLFLAGRRPVIFDELVLPLAWATQEGHGFTFKVAVQKFLARVMAPPYRWWLRACRVILADTAVHAEVSARLSHVNLRQYRVLPVGADEQTFKPTTTAKHHEDGPFEIFFCGNMRPLYGLGFVLDAAMLLKDKPFHFTIVGGNRQTAIDVTTAVKSGAQIDYKRWVPYDELPQAMQAAGLCLGGHFGGTPQALHTIAGKEFQYLASQVPTVVGASEATEPFFKHKDNALVVPQADAEALARAIEWAAKHRHELTMIAKNGRKTYDKYFSNQIIAAELSKLVDGLQ